MKKLIFTLIALNLLVALSGCQKQESRGGGDATGPDNWQGARLAIIKTGVDPVSVDIAKNSVVQVQSSDQLTIEVSQSAKQNDDFRSTIKEFQSEITCVEQDGKAIAAPEYSRAITTKRFSALEVWALLPQPNQLQARSSLKCNLSTKITNANGSTIAWPSLAMDIQVNSAAQQMTLVDADKNAFPIDQTVTLSQLAKLEFKATNSEDLLMNLKCTQYSTPFQMSELKNEKHVLNSPGSVPRYEDTRVRSPLQDCIFIFEDHEAGRYLVSPRYLVDFEHRPHLTETFQLAPAQMTSQRPQSRQPYFTLTIENHEDFPVLVGHGTQNEEMKLGVTYYYVTRPELNTPPQNFGQTFVAQGYMLNASPRYIWQELSLPIIIDSSGEHYTIVPPKGTLHIEAKAITGYGDIKSCFFGATPASLVGMSVKIESALPVHIMNYITGSDLNYKMIRLQPLMNGASADLRNAHYFSEGPNQLPAVPQWTSRTDLSCR